MKLSKSHPLYIMFLIASDGSVHGINTEMLFNHFGEYWRGQREPDNIRLGKRKAVPIVTAVRRSCAIEDTIRPKIVPVIPCNNVNNKTKIIEPVNGVSKIT